MKKQNHFLQNYVTELETKLAQKNEENTNTQKGKTAFLSYSSKDYDLVRSLRMLLEQQGIPCYMAPESIPAGSDYTEAIPDAICESFAMVVILSSTAQESKWVAKEIDTALDENIPIIPYQIDTAKLSRKFKFLLGEYQHIPFTDNEADDEKANKELIDRLNALRNVDKGN